MPTAGKSRKRTEKHLISFMRVTVGLSKSSRIIRGKPFWRRSKIVKEVRKGVSDSKHSS